MDNKTNTNENQSIISDEKPQPIFESVPVSEENLQPEEAPPDINVPPEESLPDMPPPVYEENKIKYFIIIGGVLAFFLIFIFVLGAFTGGKKTTGPIKLAYWGLWEDPQVFDSLIKEYEQKNKNVQIEYEKMSPQDYLQKLIVRSKKATGPDIFRFHNTWIPALSEVVSPLPPSIMSANDFNKTFYPVQQKDLKVGNYYYGLPLEIDGLVLFYNETLFKKAGIEKAPTNWEEILDNVAKLTVKDKDGKIITSGIALGTASNVEHFSDIFGWMLLQNGGDLKKLDAPEAAQILETYRKFAEPPNNFWDESMPNSVTAFIQEKVAMIFAPSWEALTIKATNPDLNMKIMSLPVMIGASPVPLASYWVEGVSRQSKNQIEAWKFLKFLVEKENLSKLYATAAKTRLFGEPYSRVDLASTLVQNEYIGSVIQQAKNFQSLPLISRTYDDGLNDGIIKYIENAINATISGVSYAEALKTAAAGINQVFTKYKIE